jgi:hypothetical protein
MADRNFNNPRGGGPKRGGNPNRGGNYFYGGGTFTGGNPNRGGAPNRGGHGGRGNFGNSPQNNPGLVQGPYHTPAKAEYEWYNKPEKSSKPLPESDDRALYLPLTTPMGQKRVQKEGETLLSVITNHLRVKDVPNKLDLYTIENSYTYVDEKGNTVTGKLDRRPELSDIWAKLYRQHLETILGPSLWATDFRKLWTNSSDENLPSVYTVQDVVSSGGRRIPQLQVTITHKEPLTDLKQLLANEAVQNQTEALAALTALVSRPLKEQRTWPVTPVGPNKFFIDQAHHRMVGLRALRGYFTSVRPGTLSPTLNINTATSAFFPPVRVCDIVSTIAGNNDVGGPLGRDNFRGLGKMLQGITLRVAYMRKNPEAWKKDGDRESINSETNRRKKFKNFGRAIKDQKFYNRDDPNDPGRTVLDYFIRGSCSP